jgi:hypothetical protein
VATEPSTKAKAWAIFDRIVANAAPDGIHSNPWVRDAEDNLDYVPDFDVLVQLLGVPLYLNAATTTGVPALALDVWLSYELRRAGFDVDAVWPRPTRPRIMPIAISSLLRLKWAKSDIERLEKKISAVTPPRGVVATSASVLGKNYLKQVDVVMSDWVTGPELLISTKRMDSSFGKNAANRVEESYGDAKNLRLRHPLAALGFVYGLRSTILAQERDTAEWLIDLLQKLGREDDAYHAVCLIMIEYGDDVAVAEAPDTADDGENALEAAGIGADEIDELESVDEVIDITGVDEDLSVLPRVALKHDEVPAPLQSSRFLKAMVDRVLDTTPITLHKAARLRKLQAPPKR